MSNHKNLIWFNKEGDYLNFNYDESLDRFQGDILFHESASDIYKTYGLYMFEEIPSFEFQSPDKLLTKKFQLFNERGLNFYGTDYKRQKINKIEPVNNDIKFSSKLIYGDNFESKFPIGTMVSFDTPFLEFNNPNKTYIVVGNRKNAILILSQVDNKNFELDYKSQYENPDNYSNLTLSGINSIGVYDYIEIESYQEKLSEWNEANFYDRYFIGQKLNINNTERNDSIVTVNNTNLIDIVHFEYVLEEEQMVEDSNLIIEVITKTDLPKIYEGEIFIDDEEKINIDPDLFPNILKPGTQFKISGGVNDEIFLTLSNIPNWNGIVKKTEFSIGDQVIFDNKIYQCVEQYTQDFSKSETASITPDMSDRWTNPTFLRVDETVIEDNISSGQIYLTSDRYYFSYNWDTNSEITLSSAVDKYSGSLSVFNIDMFYDGDKIKADLIYPSNYAIVNFYYDEVKESNKIGYFNKAIERLVGVEESLNYELNHDISEIFDYKVVFTDIDQFGIKVIINGEVYEEEVAFIFSGNSIDMDRTIDRTLRNWLSRNYIDLFRLGITTELKYTGNSNSLFYNSIRILSQYPNVEVEVEEVLVGTTADYYIEHSKVLFSDLGPYLNININGTDYGVSSDFINGTNSSNVTTTLNKWVNEHSSRLLEFGIVVNNINELLTFDIKRLSQRLDYTISTGKVNIPGVKDFIIDNKIKGNEGVVITSNEIILDIDEDGEGENFNNFEEAGFATGMALSINNTMFPLVNREYTIQYLDPNIMNVSYEGPFWGLTDSICNSSAFVTLAFNSGFGLTGCPPPIDPEANITSPFGDGFTNLEPDELGLSESNSQFEIDFNANDYLLEEYNLSNLPGTTNMVDLIYVQLSDSIYTLADSLIVHDGSNGNLKEIINLVNNEDSIKILFNSSNNYVYTLSEKYMFVINPLTDNVIHSITFQNGDLACSFEVSPKNGDVYVSYKNAGKVSIWSANNFLNNPTKKIDEDLSLFPTGVTNTFGLAFNSFEEDMYIVSNNGILRIDESRNIRNFYEIDGVNDNIFYEPVDESIYFYSENNLSKIDNDNIIQISEFESLNFNDMLFNNLTGQMNISSGSLPNSGDLILLDIPSNQGEDYDLGTFGFLGLNQFDGDLYLTAQNIDVLYVINPSSGAVVHTQNLTSGATRIINNPQRNSMWAIQPDNRTLIEVSVTLNSVIKPLDVNPQLVGENLYGTLDPDYTPRENMWLKTKEYIRKPRENFEGGIQTELYWKWEDDNTPEFFMYDFSGEQLDKDGVYAYKGVKPLDKIVLNRNKNKDKSKASLPEYQQTIFDRISYDIPFIDDQDEISTDVEPLELFIGYKSENEGAYKSTLRLFKREEIRFDIKSDEFTNINFETIETKNDRYGKITINQDSSENFLNENLKSEQLLVIYLNDITNEFNQYSSDNMSSVFKIRQVFTKSIILDFINEGDFLVEENTRIIDYPNTNDVTYLNTTFKISDKEIGRFNVYGQTEEEDERFKIELGNVGKLIGPDEVFIFKQYDIQEGGIDWTFLNKKRKELMMTKHLIYPYIGAYKSIINAINFFGYNDLELNEYYRNVNPESENFSKLFKVEIPDIFDNTVEGWEENDFIKGTYPNENYEETKLFNLTYNITDKDGNNVLDYTLDEVIIKLQGLKYWLKNNIIPLTHEIEDITGKAYVKTSDYIQHRLHDIRIINIKENMTPITFKMNEVYLMPVNSGSTVYNCSIDFYSIIKGVGKEDMLIDPVESIENTELELPDSFDVTVRTYKTYKEWEAFKSYNKGDKVKYFDFIYESVNDGNRTNNPRKYDSALPWSPNTLYETGTIVLYDRNYYSYRGENGVSSQTPPSVNPESWLNISQWKKIDLEPVQRITELRKGNNLLSYSFTVDSNVDPFIVIEVTSDNGYGEIYRDIKNYELKGLNDLGMSSVNQIDSLPSLRSPLTPIYTTPVQ